MSNRSKTWHPERRRAYRVETFGAYARCCWDRNVGRYTVQNLSHHGALLHGGPVMASGQAVELLLRLPGFGEVPLDGLVVRVSPADRPFFELAVRFRSLSPDAEDAISAVVAQEIQRARHPVLVAAGLRPFMVRGLARVAASEGVEVVFVHTPLELIRRLEDVHSRVLGVALGGRAPKIQPVEIAGFLSSLYPRVRRVFLGRPCWRTRVAIRDLVHRLVTPPFSPSRLKDALLEPIHRHRPDWAPPGYPWSPHTSAAPPPPA